MKFFAKLTTIFSHARDVAAHVRDLANKGVAIDQTILAKAEGIIATADKFLPAQAAAPTTTLIPVPDQHAATLGATEIGATP